MKRHQLIFWTIALVLTVGCSRSENFQEEAENLAHKFIIVDGHIDVPYRLRENPSDISGSTEDGDFDYNRGRKGGLNAPFMSIYIPARYQKTGGAKALADSLIDMVKNIVSEHPKKFAIATSPDDIKKQFEQGLISLPMGMENGAPLGKDLSNVQYFYDRGIRYITLTHSKDNLISDSSYDTTRDTHNGLSAFGEKVVKKMNRVGMMVDVSHISDSAFYDVMEITEAPVVATHSSARHFTPGFERNMSDDMIERLAQNNGVVMINFGSTFLDSVSQRSMEKVRQRISKKLKEKGLDPSSKEGEAFRKKYFRENFEYSTVEKVADHIDQVVNLAGIDHVGLGSDFDGVGDTLPVGIKDVSNYPNLIAELLERGYTEEEIRKICSGNIFRVWDSVNMVARTMQDSVLTTQ